MQERVRSKANSNDCAYSRAFGRLPNWVLRSNRLTTAAKVIAAIRSTFVGDYVTREKVQSRYVKRGLGKNIARAAIADLRREGYFGREQQLAAVARKNGSVTPLGTEVIETPTRDFSIVRRRWFDGRLTVDEAATLLFINAGLAGPVTYADDVARFLERSNRTAGACLYQLELLGLICTDHRDVGGRFTRRGYRMATRQKIVANSTGGSNSGGGIEGALLRTSSHGEFPLTRTADAGTAFESLPEPSLTAFGTMWEDARLLGWIHPFVLGEKLYEAVVDFLNLDAEAVEEAKDALSPQDLAAFIVLATEGRVAPAILSPAGLAAVYWMAAYVMVYDRDEEATARDGLAVILNAFADRVGRQPPTYLASLRLIAERLIWARGPEHVFDAIYQRLFDSPHPMMFAVSVEDELFLDAAL